MNLRAFQASGMNSSYSASSVVPSNSALVSDACATALRASYSAPQRGR